MWQERSDAERDRGKTTQGRRENHVCVYLLVCAKTGVHACTQMDSGGTKIKGEGGVAVCAFSGPAAPALLPSVESISDCIMLGRQGPSECTP